MHHSSTRSIAWRGGFERESLGRVGSWRRACNPSVEREAGRELCGSSDRGILDTLHHRIIGDGTARHKPCHYMVAFPRPRSCVQHPTIGSTFSPDDIQKTWTNSSRSSHACAARSTPPLKIPICKPRSAAGLLPHPCLAPAFPTTTLNGNTVFFSLSHRVVKDQEVCID